MLGFRRKDTTTKGGSLLGSAADCLSERERSKLMIPTNPKRFRGLSRLVDDNISADRERVETSDTSGLRSHQVHGGTTPIQTATSSHFLPGSDFSILPASF